MLTKRLLAGVLLSTVSLILPLRVSAQISVSESILTGRNNVQRTGVYDHETQLTPATVAGGHFQRLVVRSVEGQVAAQPLYVKGVTIPGKGVRNVLYVVTRKNFIYAFDADNTNANDPNHGQVWANPIHLVDCDPPAPTGCWNDPARRDALEATPLRGMESCNQTIGPVGITSTPVIDPVSQTMYLVARFGAAPGTHDYGRKTYHYLVSLNIVTGQEIRRVPIGDPAGNFIPFAELNRPALLLQNNVLYIAFGAPVCDEEEGHSLSPEHPRENTHGWVLSYGVPALTYLDSFNTSPSTPQNPGLAGIWQSGAGLAFDGARCLVYALTGNNGDPNRVMGEQDTPGDLYNSRRTDLGQSVLKFNVCPSGKLGGVDHFTAGNWYRLDTGLHCPGETHNSPCPNAPANWRDPIWEQQNVPGKPPMSDHPEGDSDLGSGGPVVLSNGNVLGGGKQGRIYVLSPDDFHHSKQTFQAGFNTWHLGSPTSCTETNPLGQTCSISVDDYDEGQTWGPNIHGSPAVWERPSKPNGFLYLMAEKDYLRAYTVMHDGHIVENAAATSEATVLPADLSLIFASSLLRAPDGLLISRPPKLRSPDGMPGGAISLSSNGDSNGIVWVSLAPQKDALNSIERGVLLAFDAETFNAGTLKLLWHDSDPTLRFAKSVPPTIAGGKVFLATFGDSTRSNCPTGKPLEYEGLASCGSIVVYGLAEVRPIDMERRSFQIPKRQNP